MNKTARDVMQTDVLVLNENDSLLEAHQFRGLALLGVEVGLQQQFGHSQYPVHGRPDRNNFV